MVTKVFSFAFQFARRQKGRNCEVDTILWYLYNIYTTFWVVLFPVQEIAPAVGESSREPTRSTNKHKMLFRAC